MNNTFGHPRYFQPKSGGVVRCKDGDNFYRKQGSGVSSKWVKYKGAPSNKRTHPWCGKVPAHAMGDVSKVAVGDCCNFDGSKYRMSQNNNFYRYNKPCTLSSSCGDMGSLKSMGASAASASKSGSVLGARSQLKPAKWYMPYTTCSADGHTFYALKNKWNRYKSEDYVKRKGLTSHSACSPRSYNGKDYYLDSGKYYEPRASQTATGSWFKLSEPQPTFSGAVSSTRTGSKPAAIMSSTIGTFTKPSLKPLMNKINIAKRSKSKIDIENANEELLKNAESISTVNFSKFLTIINNIKPESDSSKKPAPTSACYFDVNGTMKYFDYSSGEMVEITKNTENINKSCDSDAWNYNLLKTYWKNQDALKRAIKASKTSADIEGSFKNIRIMRRLNKFYTQIEKDGLMDNFNKYIGSDIVKQNLSQDDIKRAIALANKAKEKYNSKSAQSSTSDEKDDVNVDDTKQCLYDRPGDKKGVYDYSNIKNIKKVEYNDNTHKDLTNCSNDIKRDYMTQLRIKKQQQNK